MQRLVFLACAAAAFGIFASPLGAQQSPPQQVNEPAQPPPAPEAEPLPPPPPFPPMPSARPSHRWVDMGDRRAGRTHHHARSTRHHARSAHHHVARPQHRRTHAHDRSAHKARLAHFSRRTIRSCHAMNYRQIMRHDSCRLLMSQELAARAHRHHHRAAAHRARRHHAVRRKK
jgi:hypothetical protein